MIGNAAWPVHALKCIVHSCRVISREVGTTSAPTAAAELFGPYDVVVGARTLRANRLVATSSSTI